jgi:hypothetical protein
VKIRFALTDGGMKIALALSIGSWRRAWRGRNPWAMNLTRIYRLDLRPLEIIVAEHNAQPGALQLRIWDPVAFRDAIAVYFPGVTVEQTEAIVSRRR